MTAKLLILLSAQPFGTAYYSYLSEKFPQLEIAFCDQVSAIGDHASDSEILITTGPFLGRHADEVFEKCKRLRWLQAPISGVDNIVDRASLPADVIVTTVTGIHGAPVSEAVLMSMLAMTRHLPDLVRQQDHRIWRRKSSRLLKGATACIVGSGTIATSLAPRCVALGLKVIGISSSPRDLPWFSEVHHIDDITSVVAEADFLIVLTPHTKRTHHLIGREVFSRMKPTSFLVNYSRGGVIDESALVDALNSNAIEGAALDVFDEEPLPPSSPLWTLPNVLVTPHTGGVYDGYIEDSLKIIEANVRYFLEGKQDDMINIVKRSQ